MTLTFRGAIVTAGLLIGTALPFSTVASAQTANPGAAASKAHPARKNCNTKGYCLTEKNQNADGSGIYVGLTGSGTGIDSVAANGTAVFGDGSAGGQFQGGIVGVYSLSSQTPLESCGTPSTGCFYTDSSGDGFFAGTVNAVRFNQDLGEKDGGRVSASVALMPTATIEDSGTARLVNGVGVVRFAADFAGTLDLRRGYQVFLTPDGETRGWLYVAQKFEGGFVVREAERGHSSIDFDYRVLAHPAGSDSRRFSGTHYNPPPVR
jgi:hypothetical protein